MFALVFITVFVLIVALVVFIAYKNEKSYQEERKKRHSERKNIKPSYDPKEKIQKKQIQKQERSAKLNAETPGAKKKFTRGTKREIPKEKFYPLKNDEKEVTLEEIIQEEIVQKKPKSVKLPQCNYPKFNYSRLIKMGLSEEEALEFTKELIPQIKTQIPLIEEAMKKEDFHSMERLTHSIKGSSTTVGTGGVSDLLVDYNTYLKTGKELPIAKEYFKYLNYYAEALEKAYA
jgi:hypothetical protein